MRELPIAFCQEQVKAAYEGRMTQEEFEAKYVNTIVCGDCLDVMKDWPDDCVDAIITDPVWPNCSVWPEIDAQELFGQASQQICRVSKRVIIILGCMTNPAMLHWMTLPFLRVCWLRYARPNYAGRVLLGAEIAYVYGEAPAVRPDRSILGGECIKTSSCGKITDHPCERAEQHLEWLVHHYSNPNELVIDCFNGSGTTCVAAKKLGRRFIGIDISEQYCQIARERLKAVDTGVPVKEARQGQQALFD